MDYESEDHPTNTFHPVLKPTYTPDDVSHLPKHPKPKKILFECGRSVEEANFDLQSTQMQVFKLAKVALDTSLLCRPQIKLEFTTEISLMSLSPVPNNNFNINLFFDIVQVCNGNEEILRTYSYKNRLSLNEGEINRIIIFEPFTITDCFSQDCSGCCQYFVQVKSTPTTDLRGAQSVIVNPGNLASISAFAQGLCDDC